MKHRILNLFFLALSSLLLTTACQDDDTAPGLSVESQAAIATFAGDEVHVLATVSDEDGISRIIVSCENWGVLKEYDLGWQSPRVFNVNYRFTVPASAGRDFNETLLIDVVNKHGMHNERQIPMTYLEDTTAPVWDNYAESLQVIFDGSEGILNYTFLLSDDRSVASVKLEVDNEEYEEVFDAKTVEFKPSHTFTAMGTYPATLTITDSSDNETAVNFSIVVMVEESEDPISDYAAMYVIPAEDAPENYIVGFYQPMPRTNPYEYWTYVYAPTDNHKIAFVPTQSVTGDYFGLSPYVSTKLMNKRGYVVPVNLPTKGYYSVWIDILNHQYSVSAYTPTTPAELVGHESALCMSGTGLSVGDWAMTPALAPNATHSMRLSGTLSVSAAADAAASICFTTADWAHIWRPDFDSPSTVTGWWYSAGGIMFNFTSAGAGDYPVVFDAGISPVWVTIRKPDSMTVVPGDPVSDYPEMWTIPTEESPSDYVLGYYRPLARTAAYEYAGQIYATAGMKIAFVPTQALDGDYFGLKSGKLVNKNGGVEPITIAAAGYYDIALNVQTQTYSVTAFTPDASRAAAIAGQTYYINGEGLDGDDWAMVESLKLTAATDLRLAGNLVTDVAAGNWPRFCLTTAAWDSMWRPTFNAAWAINGWSNAGGSDSASFESVGAGSYPLVFDAGVTPAWITVRKPN